MFDDPALEAVTGYWRARHALDGALRAMKAAPLDLRRGPEVTAWGNALEALAASFRTLGEIVPTTPRGAIEMLTVALEEAMPRSGFATDPHGMVSTRLGGVDKLEMIRRVRDALEDWG